MQMPQYFHIKKDLTFCLGQGSLFNSPCFFGLYGCNVDLFACRSSNTDVLVKLA